jgi:aminoglycoside N3'-acetyltransferase
MSGYDGLFSAFQTLGLQNKPVIAHASLKPFGYIHGGAEAVLAAMLDSFAGVIMPTHTYKTKIIPDMGPPNNGLCMAMGFTRTKWLCLFSLRSQSTR